MTFFCTTTKTDDLSAAKNFVFLIYIYVAKVQPSNQNYPCENITMNSWLTMVVHGLNMVNCDSKSCLTMVTQPWLAMKHRFCLNRPQQTFLVNQSVLNQIRNILDEILQNSVQFLMVSTKFGMNHGRKCLNMFFQDQLRIAVLCGIKAITSSIKISTC